MNMAEFIQRDLESRIRANNLDLPALSLPALARHYQVSFTPVRRALKKLVEEGFLTQLDNRRIKVAANPPDKDNSPLNRPVLPPRWEDVIAHELLLMSLRGQADFLREEAMAAHFGIGRMLLRQTFSRLAGMGVIEHVPRRGWRIRPFEERDLHSFLEIRELLEIQALRSARENLEAPVLQQLQAANEPLTPDGPPRIDNSLHAYVIERAGNRFISSFFSQNGGYFRWLFDNATLEAHLIAEMACEHAAILKASLDRDWATAESILSKHIRAQGAIVQQLIAKVSG